MTKQGEDLYHYNITNRITPKSPINCVQVVVFSTPGYVIGAFLSDFLV
jgi:hypothetical protein